jgi:hypothetical protein
MFALLLGRSLAIMCHPQLAWRRLPPSGRAALATGYTVVSYVASLVMLFAFRA